ncbi:MAG: N-acyl-D-amino-acid deacylase family protein [Actinomycetota bacterium]
MTSSSSARIALVGGLVADGSGDAPFPADVVVADGVIESVVPWASRPQSGYDAQALDCDGRVVAPGLVDIHCHSDLSVLAYPDNSSRISQGVTTEVVGNCGMTPAPSGGDPVGLAGVIGTIDVVPTLPWTWSDVAGWLRTLDQTPRATHIAAHVGHGSARFAVAGAAGRPLSASELAALERELEAGMDAGCVGASLGLMYAPGEAATAEELRRIASTVARHDGLLSVHLRDYRVSALRDAIDEVAGPARDAGARLQISHLRGIGGENGFADVIEHIERLRSDQDIAADAYPYVHGHTTLLQLLPSELRTQGPAAAVDASRVDPAAVAGMLREAGYAPDDITVMKATARPEAAGVSLSELDGDPWRWLVDLLLDCDGVVDVAVQSGVWADVDLTMRTDWVSIASDGTALDPSHRLSVPHPRSWGAFPAAYRRMRSVGVPIGSAVRRMSTAPAQRVGLTAGIAVGARADLCVFDDTLFASPATFAHPAQQATGLDHVLVNGVVVYHSGGPTGARPGDLLTKEKHHD